MNFFIFAVLLVIAVEIHYVVSRLWQIHKTVHKIYEQGEKDG